MSGLPHIEHTTLEFSNARLQTIPFLCAQLPLDGHLWLEYHA